MNTTNFNETMDFFTDKLQINEMTYTYDERHNRFYSDDVCELDIDGDGDIRDYLIIIKLNSHKNVGTVVLGETDGIKFFEYRILGQISLENERWTVIL